MEPHHPLPVSHFRALAEMFKPHDFMELLPQFELGIRDQLGLPECGICRFNIHGKNRCK
jgi:hypothetical protein